jgi:hypothetical protein
MTSADNTDEILHEHQHILEECKAFQPILKGDIGSDLPPWVATCRKHFHKLHMYLREHFYHEEAGGFMKPVLDQSPTFRAKVQKLEQEHLALRKECEQIEAALLHDDEVSRDQAFEIIGRIESLITRLHAHERAENNLMQDAFFEDIGTKD